MSFQTEISKKVSIYYELMQKKYSAKYVREVLIGLGISVALVGGYFLHQWHIHHREQNAFVALVDVVESFSHSQKLAQGFDQKKDKEKIEKAWNDTETFLDALYKEHQGSYLAPHFLLYKSQIILEKEGDVDKARELLEKALTQISKKSELYSLFNMTRIKMSFDSEKKEVQEASLKDLIAISQSPSDVAYQEALYVLGVYYISVGDESKAQESWKRLVDSADKDAILFSPWVKLAKDKIVS